MPDPKPQYVRCPECGATYTVYQGEVSCHNDHVRLNPQDHAVTHDEALRPGHRHSLFSDQERLGHVSRPVPAVSSFT